MLRCLPALIVVACTELPELGPSSSGEEDDTAEGADTADTGDTSGVDEVPGVDDRFADDLYSLRIVHTLDITISEEGVASLRAAPYEFVSADIRIDDELFENVGIRIKGRLGSYRTIDQKPAFKIDADTFVGGLNFHGLEKLNVNNMVQDHAHVHDYTAYKVYNEAGIPAPRVGYLWVTINDAIYGLYANIESYDQHFLERNFANPDGNLYDGDYYLYPDGSYQKLDFDASIHHMFQLDEGRDVEHEDIYGVTAALTKGAGSGAYDDIVGAAVDIDHHLNMWATEVWVGQYDGYTYNQNNYRVYFDPDDGLARLMPWDHDWAFYEATPITSPYGYLSYWCKADETCHAEFQLALARVSRLADEAELEAAMDEAITLIAPYVESDPRREQSADTIASYQAALRSWIQNRSAYLESASGL